jgi:hypothetical protein
MRRRMLSRFWAMSCKEKATSTDFVVYVDFEINVAKKRILTTAFFSMCYVISDSEINYN